MDIELTRCDNLLRSVMTDEEYNNLWNNIPEVIKDERHGIVCMEEIILSAEFYYHCSQIIDCNRNKRVIVDCGSSVPVWQYFFKDYFKYIAIDSGCDFDKFLTPLPNAEFIRGTIEDELPKIIEKYGASNIVGISKLCVSYFGGRAREEFDKLNFKISL